MRKRNMRGLMACVFAAVMIITQTGCGQIPARLSGTEKADSEIKESTGPGAAENPVTKESFYFDTICQITVYGIQASEAAGAEQESSGSEEEAEQSGTSFSSAAEDVITQAFALCSDYEKLLSKTREGSDIWNINNAGGQPVEVAPETAAVIKAAIEYAKESDGLFDITIGAVSSLWDFVEGVKPSDEAIQAALPHVDYRCIQVDGTTVTLSDPQAKLDLGGIAKGYITDDLVKILKRGGCKNASLSLGGNVYVMGKSFDGDAWSVGVQDPNGEQDDVLATVTARDRSVVTSGLYERSFEQDGQLYYHILDPKTGYPAATDLKSASIMTKRSLDGDAYSTILFLLGHDRAMKLIEGDKRFEGGVLVDMDDHATKSSGSKFKLLQD